MAARIRIAAVQPIEAIAWARRRKVELPAEYYGHRIARARALAFSVAGMTRLDQIEHVRESLNRALEEGGTFETWKEEMLKSPEALALPRHRLDNIFRTNLQSAYMAGRCRAIQAHKDTRPYLLYSAVNDSRTRPSHAAMDGTILPVDDPWWETHTPPNGFRCRCGVISISEAEARRRGISSGPPVNAQPDDGWDYSVCSHGQEEGVRRAVTRRESQCGGGASFADRKASILEDPVWCRNRRMRRALEAIQEALDKWDDPERLAREAIGDDVWKRHVSAARIAARNTGIDTAEAVILRTYTDRELDIWREALLLGRVIVHDAQLRGWTTERMFSAGLFLHLLDESVKRLKSEQGTFYRLVDTRVRGFGQRFREQHQVGRIVETAVPTSLMRSIEEIIAGGYAGDFVIEVKSRSARNLVDFSIKGESELLTPMKIRFKILEREDDYAVIEEINADSSIPANKKFGISI